MQVFVFAIDRFRSIYGCSFSETTPQRLNFPDFIFLLPWFLTEDLKHLRFKRVVHSERLFSSVLYEIPRSCGWILFLVKCGAQKQYLLFLERFKSYKLKDIQIHFMAHLGSISILLLQGKYFALEITVFKSSCFKIEMLCLILVALKTQFFTFHKSVNTRLLIFTSQV